MLSAQLAPTPRLTNACTISPRLHLRPALRKPIAKASADRAAPTSSEVALLQQAARTRQVAPEEVEGALARLESASQPATASSGAIDGSWRLTFSTGTKIKALQYIPVKENLNIATGSKSLSLESSVGPFDFLISGVINDWDESSRRMAFQFKLIEVFLFRNKIWSKERQESQGPKTYTFFHVDDTISAARSSAGGLNLLLRNQQDP